MTEPSPQQSQRARPLYWRVLRLKHVRPSSWQRAAFFEGALVVAAVLVLADLASAWLLLVLPVVVAAVVKGNDILVGWLGAAPHPANAPAPASADQDAKATTAADDTSPVDQAVGDESEPEPNVRVVNSPEPAAPKPRAARGRPGAAAARAQVSAAQGVRRRRAEPAPEQAKPSG